MICMCVYALGIPALALALSLVPQVYVNSRNPVPCKVDRALLENQAACAEARGTIQISEGQLKTAPQILCIVRSDTGVKYSRK
jgi:hypothetical protein